MERGASSDLFKGQDSTQECHALGPPSADAVPFTDKAITQHVHILEVRMMMDKWRIQSVKFRSESAVI